MNTLKVLALRTHPGFMQVKPAAPHDFMLEGSQLERDRPCAVPSLEAIYDRWFPEVVRWVRACGAPSAELEDLTQEVFVVVQRKLARFDGRNLPGWLYGIARRTVSDHRRRAWFRHLFRGKADFPVEEMRATPPDAEQLLLSREASQRLERILSCLSDKRRRAFVLFEIEEYSGEEIARLEGIPVRTVWTRLHHARKEFLARLAAETGDDR